MNVPRARTNVGLVVVTWSLFRIIALSSNGPLADPAISVVPDAVDFSVRSAPLKAAAIADKGQWRQKTHSETHKFVVQDSTVKRPPTRVTEYRSPVAVDGIPTVTRTSQIFENQGQPMLEPATFTVRASRWSFSGWGLYRTGSTGSNLAPNGQLGGSQAGFRVRRDVLGVDGRYVAAINLRASSPLERGAGKEMSLGLSMRRSGPLPLEFVAERRFALDRGGRNAFAALIATGVDDRRVGPILLGGYLQAGMVGLKARDGFVDGALRVESEVASSEGLSLRLGGEAWGSRQPGLSRVDVGPVASVRLRTDRAGVRLNAEWRQRVAGNALPGSGPAITIGVDY